MRTSAALLALLLATACATTQKERIDFESVKVVVEPKGADAFEVYDAKALFERGLDLMRGGVHEEALSYFQRVPEEFPESSFVIPSWFNQAVCSLALDDGAAALSAIDTYLALLPPDASEKHVLDGRFKRGAALMKLIP